MGLQKGVKYYRMLDYAEEAIADYCSDNPENMEYGYLSIYISGDVGVGDCQTDAAVCIPLKECSRFRDGEVVVNRDMLYAAILESDFNQYTI